MLKILFFSSLFFAGVNLGVFPLASVNAQNSSTETYQPGFWQPVARVDVNKPIKIKIDNQAGVPLEYELIENTGQPNIVQTDATITRNIQTPAYISIYPYVQNLDGERVFITYEVKVIANNTILVTVVRIADQYEGYRTINLQETGAIYLY